MEKDAGCRSKRSMRNASDKNKQVFHKIISEGNMRIKKIASGKRLFNEVAKNYLAESSTTNRECVPESSNYYSSSTASEDAVSGKVDLLQIWQKYEEEEKQKADKLSDTSSHDGNSENMSHQLSYKDLFCTKKPIVKNKKVHDNFSKWESICYGNQVCFLSMSTDSFLCVGHSLKCVPGNQSADGVGLGSVFTIVDLNNPSRASPVYPGDRFWLQLDTDSEFVSRKVLDPIRRVLFDQEFFLGANGSNQSLSTCKLDFDATQQYKSKNWNVTEWASHRRKMAQCGRTVRQVAAVVANIPSRTRYGTNNETVDYTLEHNEAIAKLSYWKCNLRERYEKGNSRNSNGKPRILSNYSKVQLFHDDLLLQMDSTSKIATLLNGSPTFDLDVKCSSLSSLNSNTWQICLFKKNEEEKKKNIHNQGSLNSKAQLQIHRCESEINGKRGIFTKIFDRGDNLQSAAEVTLSSLKASHCLNEYDFFSKKYSAISKKIDDLAKR